MHLLVSELRRFEWLFQAGKNACTALFFRHDECRTGLGSISFSFFVLPGSNSTITNLSGGDLNACISE